MLPWSHALSDSQYIASQVWRVVILAYRITQIYMIWVNRMIDHERFTLGNANETNDFPWLS
jgi:hypothetical protein